MQATVYRLTFKAPLHLGLEGIGAEKIDNTLHSDTLWGALAIAHLTLDLPFQFDQPAFRISSAFPFFKDRLFFPVPFGALDYLLDQVDEKDLKIIKKMKYVDVPLFEQLINGQKPPWNHLHCYERNKSFLLLQPLPEMAYEPVYSANETPRVTVDRFSDSAIEGQIFYFAQMNFARDAGLFFLAEYEDEQTKRNFEAALRFLGDEGLGADRTVGKGLFEYKSQPFALNAPQSATMFTTLSLYHPLKSEIEQGLMKRARYHLLTRKGFAFHHAVRGKRRKFVRMFGEGSLFTKIETEGRLFGDIPTVIPAVKDFIPFSVRRYGIAYTVPVAL